LTILVKQEIPSRKGVGHSGFQLLPNSETGDGQHARYPCIWACLSRKWGFCHVREHPPTVKRVIKKSPTRLRAQGTDIT